MFHLNYPSAKNQIYKLQNNVRIMFLNVTLRRSHHLQYIISKDFKNLEILV